MIRLFFLLLPATLAPRLATLLVSLVGAHFLSPSEFGYFALVVVIGEVSESTALGWIRILSLRYATEEDGLSDSNAKRLIGISVVGTAAALIVAAILCCFAASSRFTVLYLSTTVYILAFSSLRFGLTFLQIQNRNRAYSTIEGFRASSYMIATILCMVSTGSFVVSSIIGSVVVGAFGTVALLLGWGGLITHRPPSLEWSKIKRAGLPIFLILVLGSVVSSLDKVVLGLSFSKEVIAGYAIAFALGRQIFDVIAYTVNIGAFPLLVRDSCEAETSAVASRVGRTLSLVIAVSLPAAAALLASRSLVAVILVPPLYWQAIESALPIIAFGAIIINIKNNVIDNIFHLAEKNYWQIPTIAFGAAASLFVAIWSPHPNPYVSAALVFAAGSFVSLLLAVAFSRSIVSLEVNWKSIVLSIVIAILNYVVTSFWVSQDLNIFVRTCAVVLLGAIATALSLFAFRRLDV